MNKNFKLDTVYVSVSNMDKSVKFYNQLFQTKPDKFAERFSEYDFSNITFGLYCANVDGIEIEYGNNTVPNIEVSDIEKEYSRVKEFVELIDDGIMNIGDYYLFQFKDPDGNLLEFFQVKK